MANSKPDENSRGTLIALSSANDGTIVQLWADPTTHRLLVDSSSGGSSITIGTTTITSGTTTRVLYDNAGVVGEYTISGTGSVAMTTSPVFTTPNIGSATGSISGNAATVTTNANLTGVITSVGNATSIASQTGTGTKFVVDTSPTLVTPVLGVATVTTLNGNTFTVGTYTLTGQAGKTLTFNGSITLTGTDAQTYTFPTTSATLARTDAANTFTGTQTVGALVATTINGNTLTTGSSTYTGTAAQTYTFPTTTATIARTDAAQTFTGIQTIPQVVNTPLAATVSSNAATITRASRNNNFTNSSAATMAITLSTTGALDGDYLVVRIFDFSAAAQTIGWTNTENSTVSAPTTSNGSTTLPLTAGFQYNSATSKWRCIASA